MAHTRRCSFRGSASLLSGADLRFQLDELPGHLVVGPLGENAKDCQSRVIHVDAAAQWAPAGTAGFVYDVTQLNDRDSQHVVLPGKAIVLDADLQLVTLRTVLVAQYTKGKDKNNKVIMNP